MAESILFDTTAGIIAKLGSIVLKEIGLWRSSKDDLQKLKGKVSMIQAVLHDAEKQSSTKEAVKIWLEKLKEAVYDAEDLVDLFSTRSLKKQIMSRSKLGKEVRIFFSKSNQLAYGLKMAHEIRSIRERIDELAKESKQFGLSETRSYPVEIVGGINRETRSLLPRVFVGRENDKEEMMKKLLSPLDSQNNVSVISIVGFGGLGKTTLAQRLFNDEVVQIHFQLKLWVCVGESETFNKNSIVQKIVANDSKLENLPLESLKNKLFECINGRKYVLVLDDVWNVNHGEWSGLMDLLDPVGAKGSRIIITTRHRNVANVAGSVLVHQLKGLSDDESWGLLKNVAFVGGKVPGSIFEEIGKEIVKKCKGVPLAIKTIGGLLYSKESEADWLSFNVKELSTVTQLEENGILPILRLSYNHLPSHLKHCFVYCLLFPKDCTIEVETLVELWIAQGFVRTSNKTQTLKDIGLQFFRELLSRSFFQEDDFGDTNFCKMHDLMHDLAISVAGGEVTSISSNESFVEEKTRHVSIDFQLSSRSQALLSLRNATKARTILLVNTSIFREDEMIGKEERDSIFSDLKCLRALDLHAMGIERVPHSIKNLELLTYLNISGNHRMKNLPNSICSLINLQVLKSDRCESLEELPKDIRKLVKLRRLSMRECNRLTHMPRGIGELTSLELLSHFIVDKEGRGAELNELKNLKKLRGRLVIKNMGYAKIPKFEFQAPYLQQLELDWGWTSSAEDDIGNEKMTMDVLQPHRNLKELELFYYKGAKFSSWLSSLTNLEKLEIRYCKNIQRLPPFDQFPSLKELWLDGLTNLEYVEIGISLNNGGLPLFFQSLKSLYIDSCTNLKGWMRCSGTESSSTSVFPNFHCLSTLSIRGCPNLNSVPPFPTIEELTFKGESRKQLEQLLKPNISIPALNSSPPLSQLKKMTIKGIEGELSLAEELLQKLTSTGIVRMESPPLLMESPPLDLRGLRNLQLRDMDEIKAAQWG